MIPLSKRLHHTIPGWRARQALRMGWGRLSFASPRPLVEAYTMLPARRLRRLERSVRAVVRRGVEGDVVECGCAQGGSAALMTLCLDRVKSPKRVYLFDTFEGLPEPGIEDPPHAHEWTGKCKGTLDEVTQVFDRLGVRSRAIFIPGRFEVTLASHAPARISVLHLDADWYESTKVCLDNLWDRVSPGGIVQIDDYGTWDGCRRAVDEFFLPRGIVAHNNFIDSGALSIEKPSAS